MNINKVSFRATWIGASLFGAAFSAIGTGHFAQLAQLANPASAAVMDKLTLGASILGHALLTGLAGAIFGGTLTGLIVYGVLSLLSLLDWETKETKH